MKLPDAEDIRASRKLEAYFTRAQTIGVTMFVTDRTENIGTSGYRLSPELYELQLNNPEGRDSAAIVKPVHISSRVSQKKSNHPWMDFIMHYPCLEGYTLC